MIVNTEVTKVATDNGDSVAGCDLLRLRPLSIFVRSKWFPGALQAVFLVALLGLVWIGWGYNTPDGVKPKLYAKSHLTTLAVWGLWWPAMVWAAVFLGRAWCVVCPLELMSSLGERLGRLLGINQRVLPRWLAAGGVMVALYVLIQLLVSGISLHRVPAYTSLMLLSLVSVAAVTGLVWKSRVLPRFLSYCAAIGCLWPRRHTRRAAGSS